jgi:hypothetical protein
MAKGLLAGRSDMDSRKEKGEGRLGGFIFLALIIALAWAAWNVAPVYFNHYDLLDKVNEICRTPKYKAGTDERILDMLMKEVRERRMDYWIGRDNFRISTTDTGRRIVLHYERPAEVLPGWKKVFVFDYTSDQPLV